MFSWCLCRYMNSSHRRIWTICRPAHCRNNDFTSFWCHYVYAWHNPPSYKWGVLGDCRKPTSFSFSTVDLSQFLSFVTTYCKQSICSSNTSPFLFVSSPFLMQFQLELYVRSIITVSRAHPSKSFPFCQKRRHLMVSST